MWSGCERFKCPIIAAIRRALPVSRRPDDEDEPTLLLAERLGRIGQPSSSKVGMTKGIVRMTIASDPRWRKMFTRKRPTPFAEYAASYSVRASSWRRTLSSRIMWGREVMVSSAVNGSARK